MNYYIAQIEDSIFFLARKGETILVLLCDDLTVLMNCYMTVWYKRKRKEQLWGSTFYYYWEVSSKN